MATDAALTPAQARRVAIMAQDGLARAIRPVHAPFDGDVVFALSTGRRPLRAPIELTLTRLGALAADCLARAVARGVYEAPRRAGPPKAQPGSARRRRAGPAAAARPTPAYAPPPRPGRGAGPPGGARARRRAARRRGRRGARALWIARTDPRGVAVAVASDHHIPDGVAFRAGVNAALAAAGQGEIVAFGVKPTHPATAYGYIRPAEVLEGSGEARRVGEFIEKPDTRDAEAFVRAGYLWNSGNLVFRVDVLAAEVAHHAPAMRRNVSAAVDQAVRRGDLLALGPDFALAEAVSIDVAILEKSDKVAVVEIDFAWSDLGSWEAVWAASRRDGAGNAIVARAVVLDSENCLIRAEGDVQIVAVGLKRIAVVVRDNRILVCDLAAGQTLKAALDSLGHGREA